MLAEFMPVIGVITKARADQGFRDVVQQYLPASKNIVRVRAIADVFDDDHILPPMGLKELVGLTLDLFPEGQRRAFVAAQIADLGALSGNGHTLSLARRRHQPLESALRRSRLQTPL